MSKGGEITSKAPLDWSKLGFGIIDPRPEWPPLINLRYHGRVKKNRWVWSQQPMASDRFLGLRMEAGCFQYGHGYFEGLTAHATPDGRCLLFRPEKNAQRAGLSARTLCLPVFPPALFLEAVKTLVHCNLPYLPPFESQGRLYIRVYGIGVNPQLGLGESDEVLMVFYAYSAGNYYPTGLKPFSLYCSPRFERVAEKGTGKAKAIGNYAASYRAKRFAARKGCGEYLFLARRRFIGETCSANFLALRADKTYVTPREATVLDSITNDSLAVLARDLMGFKIERRRFSLEEIEEAQNGRNPFLEAGVCGTAARLNPVSRIIYEDGRGRNRRLIDFSQTGEKGGPWAQELCHRLEAIQHGKEEDRWGWTMEVKP